MCDEGVISTAGRLLLDQAMAGRQACMLEVSPVAGPEKLGLPLPSGCTDLPTSGDHQARAFCNLTRPDINHAGLY
ncbi:hypothetical protein PoB_001348700 [Plakobranchus ocellatus]|uniref:Uncharacterized protein n=1 Tax=Plakobranchus ocellatus TaxID=259542 RepID=A0AAV3YXA6_9GAST|nr:hypothetical protein PoB_001348700 [Plakobranchus ocellatus]